VENGRETTEKVRIIAQSQQVVRADFETGVPLAGESRRQFLAELIDGLEKYDALVVSDYGKGVVQQDYLREVIGAWRGHGKPVLVDPHVGHFEWYKGATIMTPNTKEAASFYREAVNHEELFSSLGYRMLEDLELDALLITRGEDGMSLFLSDRKQIHIPTVANEVYDVTGAGDTVISVLAAGVAVGAPLVDAVALARNKLKAEVLCEEYDLPVIVVDMKVPSLTFYLDRPTEVIEMARLEARMTQDDRPVFVFADVDLKTVPRGALERLHELGHRGKFRVFEEHPS